MAVIPEGQTLIVDVSNDGPCSVVCQGNIIFADEEDMHF
jgi:hypothetical protein